MNLRRVAAIAIGRSCAVVLEAAEALTDVLFAAAAEVDPDVEFMTDGTDDDEDDPGVPRGSWRIRKAEPPESFRGLLG